MPLFELEGFRVVTEKRAGESAQTEATIKVDATASASSASPRGNGPVNALDRALRRPSPTGTRIWPTSS